MHSAFNIKKLLFLFFTSFVIISCVEEYWPSLNYIDEEYLVVEGNINNEKGPYTIILSTSHSLNFIPQSSSGEYDFDYLSGAIVTIFDNLGNSEILNETDPGIYKTDENGIKGEVGRSYKVKIELPSGRVYESDLEEIPEPVQIKEISCNEYSYQGKLGYNFFVSTEEFTSSSVYMNWQIEESFEYHAPYRPSHYFNGFFANGYVSQTGDDLLINRGNPTESPTYNLLSIDYNIDSMLYCWKENKIDAFYSFTSINNVNSKLDNFPLNFIQYGDKKLRIKYGIRVKQHSISEAAYNFFKSVDEQNSFEPDDLYTQQPYQIRSNVYNIEDSNEPVLGFFYASGLSLEYCFAPPDPYPIHDIQYATEQCGKLESARIEHNEDGVVPPFSLADSTYSYLLKSAEDESTWPLYLAWVYVILPNHPIEDYPELFVVISDNCADCRSHGGTNEKPDYWD